MFKFKQSLITLVGLLVLAGVVAALVPLISRGQGNSQNAPPTRDVNIVNTPLPVTGTVNIANLGDTPLPVRDLNNPARVPFSHAVDVPLIYGVRASSVTIFVVPAGKRLVLEDAGADVRVPVGQKATLAVYTHDSSGILRPYRPLTLTFQSTETENIPNFDLLEAGESVRMYLEAGQNLAISFLRTSAAGQAGARVSVSGYLVDVP